MDNLIPQVPTETLPETKVKSSKKILVVAVILFIFGTITSFFGGFYTHLLITPKVITGSTEPIKNAFPINTDINPGSSFLPGKYYFDDTIMIVAKDDPHIALVASATRTQQDNGYLQSTRASFFNGTEWKRETRNDNHSDSGIQNNQLIKNWSINIDQSRVLKQDVGGEIVVNNNDIKFKTKTLQNEIIIRSLPGYTKFMSEGDGTIDVNGTAHQAHILYTRIYSFDASQLIVYDGKLGLKTDWVAFWDDDGNFYHVDSTNVDKPISNYQTHSIAILKAINGSVQKTFDVNVVRDGKNPPEVYNVSLGLPISESIGFTRYGSINKAPDNSYTWYMGNIKGSVTKSDGKVIPGFGIVEYIYK